jgi:hypothetical protein
VTCTLRAAIGVALVRLDTGCPCDAILAEVTWAEAALAAHPFPTDFAADITALLAEPAAARTPGCGPHPGCAWPDSGC